MRKYYEYLLNWVVQMGFVLGAIWTVTVAFLEWAAQMVLDMTVWALDNFAELEDLSAMGPGGSGALFQTQLSDFENALSTANVFFPIAEAWAMFIFMITYMTIVVILRFIKQFIPTASN